MCYHYVKQGASSDPVNNWKSPAVAHQSWPLTAFFEALSNGFSLFCLNRTEEHTITGTPPKTNYRLSLRVNVHMD